MLMVILVHQYFLLLMLPQILCWVISLPHLWRKRKLVQTLYDSITVSEYASNDEGASKGATEVGTIEELPDQLIGAETNENSGPAYDIQILRRLMTANKVPQLLPFLCLDATEMRMQSHADCSPVMLIRFHPTQETASILRSVYCYNCYTAYALTKLHFFCSMYHQWKIVLL